VLVVIVIAAAAALWVTKVCNCQETTKQMFLITILIHVIIIITEIVGYKSMRGRKLKFSNIYYKFLTEF